MTFAESVRMGIVYLGSIQGFQTYGGALNSLRRPLYQQDQPPSSSFLLVHGSSLEDPHLLNAEGEFSLGEVLELEPLIALSGSLRLRYVLLSLLHSVMASVPDIQVPTPNTNAKNTPGR